MIGLLSFFAHLLIIFLFLVTYVVAIWMIHPNGEVRLVRTLFPEGASRREEVYAILNDPSYFQRLLFFFGLLRVELRKRISARSQPCRTRTAQFLMAITVQLLPSAERPRYLEEFRAELVDLPRSQQLRHVLSVFSGVFLLRRRLEKKAANAAARRARG